MQLVAKTAQEVKEFVRDSSEFVGAGVTPPHAGAIVSWLNKYAGGDENRQIVLGWLFDKKDATSIKTLSQSELYALSLWIDAQKDMIGNWNCQPCFAAECALVLTEAIKWYNTLKKSERQIPLMQESMVLDQVANCGAVITAITDENENSLHNKDVKLPIAPLIPPPLVVVEEKIEHPIDKSKEDKYARARRIINGQ